MLRKSITQLSLIPLKESLSINSWTKYLLIQSSNRIDFDKINGDSNAKTARDKRL